MSEEPRRGGGGGFLGSVTVGERGQIVIPSEARKAYGIENGDKLLVFSHGRHGGLLLVRAELISHWVNDALSRASSLERLLAEVQAGAEEKDPKDN